MTKQINIQIEECNDCPYCKMTYHRTPVGKWEDKTGFICKKIYKYMRGDKKSIPQDCPLKDARGQGVMVGISVFLVNEQNQILVGKREDGSWGLPGGGMDAGETPKKAGKRETEEETSAIILEVDMEFATFTNDVFLVTKNEHWITLYFICRKWNGEITRVEPHKCKEWRWVDLDNIPAPVFCDWAKNIDELKKMLAKPQSSKKMNLLNSSEDNLKAYY